MTKPSPSELVEAAPSEESALPREVYSLLASANLFRIRGMWGEAVEKCMAAMRLAPNSSSAQSLLGDIYENQGHLDDAIQWYSMALDINPDSHADRMKLNRAVASKEGRVPPQPPRLPQAVIFPQSLQSKSFTSPDRALRVAALSTTILAVGIIIFALAFSPHRLSMIGLGPETSVNSQPLLLPAAPAAMPDDRGIHDQVGQALMDSLRTNAALAAQGITVDDAAWDPRSNHVILTIGCVSAVPTRALILQSAVSALEVAVQTSDPATANLLTIRCLLVSGNSSTLVFVGDIPRSAVPAPGTDPAALPTGQLQAAFSNSWWASQIPT